jgi:hypothetical protein
VSGPRVVQGGEVTVAEGVGNLEIGRKPISNPKSEILNWTRVADLRRAARQSNSKFWISDLRFDALTTRGIDTARTLYVTSVACGSIRS